MGENPDGRKTGVISQPLNSPSTTTSNNIGRSVDRPSGVNALTKKLRPPPIPSPLPTLQTLQSHVSVRSSLSQPAKHNSAWSAAGSVGCCGRLPTKLQHPTCLALCPNFGLQFDMHECCICGRGENGSQNASVDTYSRCKATEQGSKPQLSVSTPFLPSLPCPPHLTLSPSLSLFRCRIFSCGCFQTAVNTAHDQSPDHGIPSLFSQESNSSKRVGSSTSCSPSCCHILPDALSDSACWIFKVNPEEIRTAHQWSNRCKKNMS